MKCNLKETISVDGNTLGRTHLYDYSRHLLHTEELDIVVKRSLVKEDVNALEKYTDTKNIDYACDGVDKARDDRFILNVTMDLTLRGFKRQDLPPSRDDLVAKLRDCLNTGRTVRRCRNALEINEKALGKQVLNPGSLPCCILHAKMRMCEKIIQQIILAGMRKNATGQHFDNYCKKVEDMVNSEILSRTTCNEDGHWKVPLDKKDKKKLGDVKLSGPSADKFMAGFNHLVDACTSDYTPEYREKWQLACSKFLVVIKLLESREEFSSDRVDAFQLQCDDFGHIFFALTGRDGMTNYFHILRSGHFSYFFRKYGNLYLLSQQGWENVNGTYKRTFHNNTQKGGGVGGSSKLAPVMYTLARAMLWRYGYLDKHFAVLGHTDAIDAKYGKVKGLHT